MCRHLIHFFTPNLVGLGVIEGNTFPYLFMCAYAHTRVHVCKTLTLKTL